MKFTAGTQTVVVPKRCINPEKRIENRGQVGQAAQAAEILKKLSF
jgi:hypothetical protein